MEIKYCYHCMQPAEGTGECPHCHHGPYEQPPLHHLKPGSRLQGRYLIGKALGEGGFGITYLGRDTTLDMRIAVKEYYPNGFSNRNHQFSNEVTLTQNGGTYDFESEMQRFLNEARMLAKFSDEQGIVGVRDFFRENNTAYIVMEYLDGITMKQYLSRGTFPAQKLFDLMAPVMASLNRIHAEGMIHRDISPDNIMMLKNGQLKLLDFGAAREVNGDKSLSVVLKPGYAPEEQYRSKGHQGPWTDVYALSATMYKCITGKTPDESLERVYEDNLLPPSKLGVEISPKQEAALMQGLCVRAKERTQSVAELMQGLQPQDREDPIHNVHIQGTGEPVQEEEEGKTIYQDGDISPRKPEIAVIDEDDKTVRDLEIPNHPEKDPIIDTTPVRKNKKKLPLILGICAGALILIGAAALLLGGKGRKAPVAVTDIPGDGSYSLEAVGQFQDAERNLKVEEKTLRMETQDGFAILNALGEDTTGKVFTDTEYLGDGLYLVRQETGTVNNAGLLTRDGELLFEGVCLIDWPQKQGGVNYGRYLLVYDAAEQTEDTEHYLVCQSDTGRVYSSNVGGTLYTGTIRVYDRKAKDFVQNLPAVTDEWNIEVCGNSLLLHKENGTDLYNCNGKLLLELPDAYPDVGDGIFSYSEGSTYRVCDETGKQLYYSNSFVSVISGSRYLQCNADGLTKVMDETGNQVLSDLYETVLWHGDGLFKVKMDGKYGLVWETDKEFLPCEYDSITRLDRGYGYVNRGDVYDLFGPEGIIGVNMPYAATSLNYINDDHGAYVINRRDFALTLDNKNYNAADYGLIILKGGERNLYGVVDLISGTQLLEYGYELIYSTDGYLYAYRNGTWEIYQVHFTQGQLNFSLTK